MEILLTLTYVALCYAVFKLFRIPVNQWTLATAALGGIFGLSLLFITMAYNHPFSTNARIYYTVTPILPAVRGRVIEVPVEDRTNQHLEAGDVLFKIDPKPYEYTVAEKRAGLADAEANIAQLKASVDQDQTTVRAPTGGFVTELALRPGVYVVPAPFRPAMVFVNDSQKDRQLAAAFQQNALQRVRAGDEAEVLFKGIPGRVFKAKVRVLIDAIAGGQLQTTGTLVNVVGPATGDRALALLDIVDDMSAYQVPLGSAGEAAIYTEHFHELSLLRKILLRMRSWQNYAFFEAG